MMVCCAPLTTTARGLLLHASSPTPPEQHTGCNTSRYHLCQLPAILHDCTDVAVNAACPTRDGYVYCHSTWKPQVATTTIRSSSDDNPHQQRQQPTQDVVVLAIATCQHMLGACRQRQQQQQHRRQRGPSGSAAHACPTAERCSSSAGRGLPFFAGPAVCRCADRHCSCVLLDRLSEQDLRQEREVTRALPTPGNRETVGSEAAHVDATAPLVSASPVAPRRCARSLRGREAAGTARVGSLGKGVGPSTPPHARKRVPLPHPGCST
eukprot:365323-Chlamydomonas_euryale.AAC.16